jgi:hypothetical protein
MLKKRTVCKRYHVLQLSRVRAHPKWAGFAVFSGKSVIALGNRIGNLLRVEAIWNGPLRRPAHSAASISRATAGASASASSASSRRRRVAAVAVSLASSRSQTAISSSTLATMRRCSAGGGRGTMKFLCCKCDQCGKRPERY